MFEEFTPEARQIVVLAMEEARSLNHEYVGTEHMLLGLFRSSDAAPKRVLESLGLTAARVRAEVLRLVGEGERGDAGQLPFTPRAKAALELALREAHAVGQASIAPRHLLLGIAGEGQGVGARILREADADNERLRTELDRPG
jgi:ATP-dependent Clp protease ATP-binding subunit ClpC